MSPTIEMLIDALDNTAVVLLFAFVVMASFCALTVLLMVFLLAARAVFRWATRRCWNDVIVSVERKALRSR